MLDDFGWWLPPVCSSQQNRKQHGDEHEDDEYINEHDADAEMMLTLSSVAQNGN